MTDFFYVFNFFSIVAFIITIFTVHCISYYMHAQVSRVMYSEPPMRGSIGTTHIPLLRGFPLLEVHPFFT